MKKLMLCNLIVLSFAINGCATRAAFMYNPSDKSPRNEKRAVASQSGNNTVDGRKRP